LQRAGQAYRGTGGHGVAAPAASNETAQGRWQNRRVEVKVYPANPANLRSFLYATTATIFRPLILVNRGSAGEM